MSGRTTGGARFAARFAGALLAILAVGAGVRLSHWNQVFTPRGVRFVGDTDNHYHLLRAERMLHGDPDGSWFDRNMNYPEGARILWPPGWDALIAASGWISSGPRPSRADLEGAAAVLPVAVGLLGICAIVGMGAGWVGVPAALLAGLLAAVLPLHVEFSLVGRPDQHVAELLVLCLVLWAFERATRGHSRIPRALLAVGLALGPWVWQGSALNPALITAFAAAAYVWPWAGPGAALGGLRSLAWGGVGGGVLLALSMSLLGPSGALRTDGLNGLGALQPAALLAVAVFAGAVAAWEGWRPASSAGARAGRVLVSASVPLALLVLAFPAAVAQGLRSLTGADPWLASIPEFRPILFGGVYPAGVEIRNLVWGIGPVLLAPLAAVPAFRRRWTAEPAARYGLSLLVFGSVVFVLLALRAVRFKMYAGPFLVLWGGLFLSDAFERAREASGRVRLRRLAVAGLLLAVAVAPVIATLPPGYPTAVPEELIGELRSLREHASGRAPRAVMAPWQLGHAIQYYSGLPVVATPFGTDLGPDGMRDLAAFYYAPDPAAAEELLRRRGVGYVLLQNPYEDVASAFELAPAGTPPVLRIERDWVNGPRLRDLPAARNNLPGWLWQLTGTPRPGTREALEGYRLLHETPGGREKLFEVVDGARLQYTGASPGQPVVASTTLVTNQGRSVSWSTASKPGPDGSGTLRLPYATGANGDVQAGPVVIRSGSVSVQLAVPPEAVLAGATSTLRLDAPGTTR